MNLRDALCLPSLSGSKIICGRDVLEQEVTGIMVLEATDIASWGKRGQLIVTSFYALQGLDEAELETFFAEAARIGIAGMAFKPERLVGEVSPVVVTLCERYGIPLLELSRETRYDALLNDVMGHILDSNLTLLNRFFDVHRQTMELALKQPTVLDILMTLRRAIHVECTYLDASRGRHVSTNENLARFETIQMSEVEGSESYRTFHYFDAILSYAEGRERGGCVVRIPSIDGLDHFLLIHAKSSQLKPLDIMGVENIVSLLQMEVLKQNAINQRLFFRNNSLAYDLMFDPDLTEEQVDQNLRELGIGQEPHYQVLLIRVRCAEDNMSSRTDEVLLAIRRRLKLAHPHLVYYEASGQLILIHNHAGTSDAFATPHIRSILEEAKRVPGLPAFYYLAGLSEQGERKDIGRLARQVTDMARFLNSQSRHDDCMSYDDLGIYKMLLRVQDVGELENYVDPRVAQLHDERPELFETMAALCETNLNYPRAGEQLFIHPKTVRYRVEKAEQLSGIDVHRPDDFMQVMLAWRIYALLDTRG